MKNIALSILFLTLVGQYCLGRERYALNSCRIYGLLKYYGNCKQPNLDSSLLVLFPKLKNVIDDGSYNKAICEWLNALGYDSTRKTESTYMNAQNIDSLALHIESKNEARANTSFRWVFDGVLNTENTHRLLQLLLHYKPYRASSVKRYQKVLYGHREFLADQKKIPFTEVALLGLFQTWNIVEYFFPYKHLMDNLWSDCFEQCYDEFATVSDRENYIEALKHLTAFLADSHVSVSDLERNRENARRIPVFARYFDTGLIVTHVLDGSFVTSGSIERGDRILSYNGILIDSLWGEFIRTNANSTLAASKSSFPYYVLVDVQGEKNSAFLQIQRGTSKVDCVLQALTLKEWISSIAPVIRKVTRPTHQILEGNIGYLYVPQLQYFRFGKHYRKVKHMPDLILDCRGYGTMAIFQLIRILSTQGKDATQHYYVDPKYPGVLRKSRPDNYFTRNVFEMLLAFKFGLHIKGKVVPSLSKAYGGSLYVLTDNNVMSFGETVQMIIKQYRPDAVFIGRPTMGANGNVCVAKVAGNVEIHYSGVDFQFSDGSQLQRKGIQPDILVEDHFGAKGEDTILNTALDLIRARSSKNRIKL